MPCRAAADSLQQLASSAAEECACDGAPCLLVVADRLAQAAEELAAAETAEAAAQRQQPPAANGAASAAGMATQGSGSSGGRQQERQLVLSRRCVWFHHIKNLEKRKSIVQWGRELFLGGWSKPGFPGIVLVEVCCAGMLLPAAACCVCCASSTGRLLLPGLGSCCLPAPSRCRLKLWLRVLHGSCTACCSQPPALTHVHLTALHPLPGRGLRHRRIPVPPAPPALAGHGCSRGGGRINGHPAGVCGKYASSV